MYTRMLNLQDIDILISISSLESTNLISKLFFQKIFLINAYNKLTRV